MEGPIRWEDKRGRPRLQVPFVDDFPVSGLGDAPAWGAADWNDLNVRPGGHEVYRSRFKVLASLEGLYVLLEGEDRRLSAWLQRDFEELWTQDVFELFLWPDPGVPIYFEYEISPLGRELPLLVPQLGGRFLGWLPWRYEGSRRVVKAVTVWGGAAEPGAAIRGWRAEVLVPYELLAPLRPVPPAPGTSWRANFYRVDYDDGRMTEWDWARVGPSFHELGGFGELVFVEGPGGAR